MGLRARCWASAPADRMQPCCESAQAPNSTLSLFGHLAHGHTAQAPDPDLFAPPLVGRSPDAGTLFLPYRPYSKRSMIKGDDPKFHNGGSRNNGHVSWGIIRKNLPGPGDFDAGPDHSETHDPRQVSRWGLKDTNRTRCGPVSPECSVETGPDSLIGIGSTLNVCAQTHAALAHHPLK